MIFKDDSNNLLFNLKFGNTFKNTNFNWLFYLK